jgi:hypothetical protein
MTGIWRLSALNGLLLACYFVPVWTTAALKIVLFPIRGLYERANISPAIFVSDYFQFSALGTVRFAWLLAMAKLVVVGFFAIFALLTARAALRKKGDGDEALAIALIFGSVLSFASMIMASHVGESAALRLHATELLLLLGGLILLVVDSASYGVERQSKAGPDPQFHVFRPNA